MSNFLQLCQRFCRENGLPSSPGAVTSQTGMLGKVVEWVADADVEIQSTHSDWDFLFSDLGYSASTAIGTKDHTKPSDLGMWDKESFYLDYTATTWKRLKWGMTYRQWRDGYRNGTQTNDKPDFVIIKPDKNIILYPPPDAVYTLTADYWKTPTRMDENADESVIPTRYERIILAKAKMYWAHHEGAWDEYAEAEKEYSGLILRLEADHLPGRQETNMGYAEMTVVPE